MNFRSIASTLRSVSTSRFLLCSTALLSTALLIGCQGLNKPAGESPAKTGPMGMLDEICHRSLADDAGFVRGKITPALLMEAAGETSGPRADKFVREMMDALRVCRPLKEETSPAADKVVLQVAGVKESIVWQYHIDMACDARHGWQIASKLYDEQRIPPAKQQ